MKVLKLPSFISLFLVSSIVLMGCTDMFDDDNDKSTEKDEVEPPSGFVFAWKGRNDNRDFLLLLKSTTPENQTVSLDLLSFKFYAPDWRFLFESEIEYGEIIGDNMKNQQALMDLDNDTMLSTNDMIIFKSVDHIDDDGNTNSPGLMEAGYYVELYYDDVLWYTFQFGWPIN